MLQLNKVAVVEVEAGVAVGAEDEEAEEEEREDVVAILLLLLLLLSLEKEEVAKRNKMTTMARDPKTVPERMVGKVLLLETRRDAVTRRAREDRKRRCRPLKSPRKNKRD